MDGCEHDPEMFEYDGECMSCSITQLKAQLAALRKDAKFVYDDLKMRAGDGVVPISHSAWEKVCRMAALNSGEGKEDDEGDEYPPCPYCGDDQCDCDTL
jgi:predicted  nucleic acid-binding Zn-ribbon protein